LFLTEFSAVMPAAGEAPRHRPVNNANELKLPKGREAFFSMINAGLFFVMSTYHTAQKRRYSSSGLR
ncbi:hypothetical protein JTL93_37280, partial [Pseudomonas aeruginosa]|nr:hypothetical protein [Pseudomonas aeruginosa]